MKRDRYLIALILVATIILTVQCAKASPTEMSGSGASPLSPTQVGESPIDRPAAALQGPAFSIDAPLREDENKVEGTGPVQVGASPIRKPATVLQGPPFSIDEPLRADDQKVEGTGPAQVGILVVDVTLMGEVLGRGQIGDDGRFSISVEPPLIVNHRIGLMLDGQAPGIVQTQDALDQLGKFSGPNAIIIPRVGRLYEAASVKP